MWNEKQIKYFGILHNYDVSNLNILVGKECELASGGYLMGLIFKWIS